MHIVQPLKMYTILKMKWEERATDELDHLFGRATVLKEVVDDPLSLQAMISHSLQK